MHQVRNEVNGIIHTITFGDISLDEIRKSEYQKPGTLTAQLRQEVKTVSQYPEAKTETSMQKGLFGIEKFGFEKKTYETVETRMAWIPVPASASELEVKKAIAAANQKKAVIYKVLSNHPILDENQKYSISVGQRTMDDFANAQVVRYPENHDEKPNQIIRDRNGKVQYRRTYFWDGPMEDSDARTADLQDQYLTPEIAQELQGMNAAAEFTLSGQTI